MSENDSQGAQLGPILGSTSGQLRTRSGPFEDFQSITKIKLEFVTLKGEGGPRDERDERKEFDAGPLKNSLNK